MKYSLPRIRRPGTLRKLAGALGLLLVLGLLVTSAVPVMAESIQLPPHTIFGTVTIGTDAAPDGTPVEARIGSDIMKTGVVAGGMYMLEVPADNPDTGAKDGGESGDTVDLYVDGVYADSHTPFTIGEFTLLDLTVAEGGGGDQQTATYDLEVISIGCCDITVAYDTVSDTVIAGDTQTYTGIEENIDVMLTAVETETCELVSWQIDQDTPVTDNPVTVTMSANHTAVATCQTVEVPEEPSDNSPVVSIPLVQGWNTFSTPIALDESMDTWGEFKTVNGLDVDVALYYDGAQEIWVICQDAELLKVLEGYYVCMASTGTAEIVANPANTAPPVKALAAGLNCIGLASLVDVDVETFLTSVYEVNSTGYTLVINPPVNGAGDWDNNVYLRDGENPPTMKVGKAYWVNMLNPGDLVGFTSTPLEP